MVFLLPDRRNGRRKFLLARKIRTAPFRIQKPLFERTIFSIRGRTRLWSWLDLTISIWSIVIEPKKKDRSFRSICSRANDSKMKKRWSICWMYFLVFPDLQLKTTQAHIYNPTSSVGLTPWIDWAWSQPTLEKAKQTNVATPRDHRIVDWPYSLICETWQYLEPLAPLLWEIKICAHWVFYRKFNSQELLFEAFFDIISNFGSIEL